MLPLPDAIAQLEHITFKLRVEKRNGELTWGTGFFVSSNGYALTASHLLEDYAKIDAHYKGQWISLEYLRDNSLPENDGDIALLKWPQPFVDLSDLLFPIVYLDLDLPKQERIKFWAGRPVCVFGFPCELHGHTGRFLNGNIDASHPLAEDNMLRFCAGDRTRELRGISGAPILDRETAWVIAVEHGYIRDRDVVYATEIGRLARTWPDLTSHAKPLKKGKGKSFFLERKKTIDFHFQWFSLRFYFGIFIRIIVIVLLFISVEDDHTSNYQNQKLK